jgi:hypothetical protein
MALLEVEVGRCGSTGGMMEGPRKPQPSSRPLATHDMHTARGGSNGGMMEGRKPQPSSRPLATHEAAARR